MSRNKQASKANEAEWEANRRKFERVLDKSLPRGEYENAYQWDNKGSKHAENRNERAAQEFDTIYGNTRPGDDWEYAGQQSGRSWRGKDGSGGKEPDVGIWTRKKKVEEPKREESRRQQPAAAAKPARVPSAPAFNASAYAAPTQAGSGSSGSGSSGTGSGGSSNGNTPPGTTISREGFDVTPHYYNAYVSGQANAYDSRTADEGTRFAGSEGFRGRLRQRIAVAQQALGQYPAASS